MNIYSFYTPNYASYAKALRLSLRRFSLPHVLFALDRTVSWRDGCGLKPSFMLMMHKLEEPFVWLDIDTVVRGKPHLLLSADTFEGYDLALHRFRGKEYNTGCVVLLQTPATRNLLERWVEAEKTRGSAYGDQDTLAPLMRELKPRLFELPLPYYWPDTLARSVAKPGERPIIFQRQASRKIRKLEEICRKTGRSPS